MKSRHSPSGMVFPFFNPISRTARLLQDASTGYMDQTKAKLRLSESSPIRKIGKAEDMTV